MANLKNITDLPVIESAEGVNLIVNDNGAAKQIAASAVGAQADWNETDETSSAFIKNKPVIDGVLIMDMTTLTSDNLMDTAYGNTVKEALLNGKTVLQYDGTYYFQIVAFNIVESTTGEVFLNVYTSGYATTTGISFGLRHTSLAITL